MPFLRNESETSSLSEVDGTVPNAFQKLVADLSAVLGPSSGLDSDDVDPADIQRLMENYTSNEQEWKIYAMGDASRTYTRNLVDEGNGKSNLVRNWIEGGIHIFCMGSGGRWILNQFC